MGPDAGTAFDARPGTAPGTPSATSLGAALAEGPTITATPQQASRYRSLRGKSVSSIRRKAFDIFQDDDTTRDQSSNGRNGGGNGVLQNNNLAGFNFSALRSRSSSLSATRAAAAVTSRGNPGPGTGLGLSGVHQIPTDVPPLPRLPLSPRPVNVPNSPAKSVGVGSPGGVSPAVASSFFHPDDEVKPPAPLKLLSSKPPLHRPPPPPPRQDSLENIAPPDLRRSGLSTAPCSPRRPGIHPVQGPREVSRWEEEVARLEAETDRILAEQKKRDLARLQAQLAATPTKSPKSSLFDKLIVLSKGKKSLAPPSQPGTPASLTSTIFSLEFGRSSSSSFESAPSPDHMALMDQGAKGLAPQIDAPTAAVNGGERRVTVRCLSSTISLPVTVDTSVVDILYSSANFMTHQLDPATSIIIECYTPLSLERRLRRYERIRDVMNSWDRDAQNSLLILPPDGRQEAKDLDYGSVPRTQDAPPGFCVQIYHSSRPGKWSKRWITLLESGQIFSAKKQDAKPSEKDSTVLCHLSDFDIYTPKESTVRRHIKPPGKFCYAIKSQQKTIVFPDGENFVHYFSTDDTNLSQQFHDFVHGWRSWYLVNKQVDLQKKDKIDAPSHQSSIKKSKSVVKHGHLRLKLSVDDTPYMIGAFEPLLDLERFNKPLEEFGKDFIVEEKPVPKPTAAPKSTAPVARQPSKRAPQQKALTKTSAPPPPVPQASSKPDEAFSAGGLLGEGYEKRKQAQDTDTVDTVKQQEGPFTGGASLLNKVTSPQEKAPQTPEAKSWFPSAEQHSARVRTQTTRSQSVRHPRRPATADNAAQARRERPQHSHQQQPLINLTDSFPEPPQWRDGLAANHGQGHAHGGHGVRAPANGPLINFVNGGQAPGQAHPNDPAQRGLVRSNTRVGNPPSGQQSPLVGRQRSRSIAAGSSQPSSRRFHQDEPPPVPPLPNRSLRRDMPSPPSNAPNRGRDTRPQEPLVNRAR